MPTESVTSTTLRIHDAAAWPKTPTSADVTLRSARRTLQILDRGVNAPPDPNRSDCRFQEPVASARQCRVSRTTETWVVALGRSLTGCCSSRFDFGHMLGPGTWTTNSAAVSPVDSAHRRDSSSNPRASLNLAATVVGSRTEPRPVRVQTTRNGGQAAPHQYSENARNPSNQAPSRRFRPDAGRCSDFHRTQEVSGSNPLSSMPRGRAWLCGKRQTLGSSRVSHSASPRPHDWTRCGRRFPWWRGDGLATPWDLPKRLPHGWFGNRRRCTSGVRIRDALASVSTRSSTRCANPRAYRQGFKLARFCRSATSATGRRDRHAPNSVAERSPAAIIASQRTLVPARCRASPAAGATA